MDFLSNTFSDIGDAVGSAASEVGSGVSNAASAVGTGISDAASAVGTGISDAASYLGGALNIGGDAGGVSGLTQAPLEVGADAPAAFEGAVVPTAAPGAAAGAGAIAAPAGSAAGADVIDYGGGDPTGMNSASDLTAGTGTPPAAPPDAPPAGKPNSIVTAFNNPSVSNIGSALGNNANWLLPAAALGTSALLGNAPAKGSAQVSQEAAQLSASGQELQTYLTNGTLPPGVQASITSAAQTAKAAVRAQYAKMGMSGSSAELADLSHVDTTAMSSGVDIATKLMSQGVADTQISAQLYGELMNNAISSDKSLVSALSALSGAAARPTVTLGTGS
jgi:hypothetical protein